MANSIEERITRAVLNGGRLDWEHELRTDAWRYGDEHGFTYRGSVAVDVHGVEMRVESTPDLIAAREAADTSELLGLSYVFPNPCNPDNPCNNSD